MQRPELRPPARFGPRQRHQALRWNAVAVRAEGQVIDIGAADQAVDQMPDIGSDATPSVSRRQRGRIDKDDSAAILVSLGAGPPYHPLAMSRAPDRTALG